MKNVLKVLTAMFVLAVSMLCFTCRHGFVAVKEVPSDYCNVDIPATTSFKIYAKSHRNVKIDSFLMCSHEVTQGEWQWVLGNVDKFIKYDTNGKGANYPMYNVSWLDAVTFCNALSEKHRLDKCYTINGNDVTCDFSKNGYRLPTASEWEYASCAGSSEDLPYSGATTASDKDFDQYVWYYNNSGGKLHEVSTKAANGFGLHDMSGNVWEWCWDWCWDLSNADYTETDNPRGAATGSKKVFRGGGYKCDGINIKARSLVTGKITYTWKLLGFRVCRSK